MVDLFFLQFRLSDIIRFYPNQGIDYKHSRLYSTLFVYLAYAILNEGYGERIRWVEKRENSIISNN